MKYLEAIWSVLQAALFILSWRVTLDKEKRETAKELEKQADEKIRSGDFTAVVGIWSRMRNL